MCRIIKSYIDRTELRKILSTCQAGISAVAVTSFDKQPRGMMINSLILVPQLQEKSQHLAIGSQAMGRSL